MFLYILENLSLDVLFDNGQPAFSEINLWSFKFICLTYYLENNPTKKSYIVKIENLEHIKLLIYNILEIFFIFFPDFLSKFFNFYIY